MVRVLDVGCGAGHSMAEQAAEWHGQLSAGQLELTGLDIDEEALTEGRRQYPSFHFVRGAGERLPFSDARFDIVTCRVALPYMDIPLALREMRRVLAPGGELRLKLHPLGFTLSELSAEVRSGTVRNRLQNLVYRIYVLANGAAFHLGGFNFRFPLARRRCESFQTAKGMRRALRTAGFEAIDISCWDGKIVRPHAGNCRVLARLPK